jgi:predicted small secreted protein
MQRTRLLAPCLVALLASTLALAACNSSSVSGSSQKATGSATVAERTAQGPVKSSPSQTLPEAWVAKIKAVQAR